MPAPIQSHTPIPHAFNAPPTVDTKEYINDTPRGMFIYINFKDIFLKKKDFDFF